MACKFYEGGGGEGGRGGREGWKAWMPALFLVFVVRMYAKIQTHVFPPFIFIPSLPGKL